MSDTNIPSRGFVLFLVFSLTLQRYRLSGAEYVAFKEFQDSINSQYESSIKTEFSLNGAGILEEVSSVYLPPYEDTLKNVKGVKMTPPGERNMFV